MDSVSNEYPTKKNHIPLFQYHKNVIKNIDRKKYVFSHEQSKTIKYYNDFKINIVSNERDLNIFYRFPWNIYRNDKYWVPPIWIEIKDFFSMKNPFWTHADARLFMAYKNHKVVGRIAAIVDNKFCETVGKKIGYFGFFECIQDFKCAEALLQSAQDWLISQKMTVMRGPIDGRIDVGCGFLYNGFDSLPSLLSSYSPKYYISFAEKFNMKKTRDQLVYYIDLTKPIPNNLKEKAQRCASSGIKIRKFNRLRTDHELKWWIDLFMQTFADHWGYVPVSVEEIRSRFGVRQLRWLVDPRLFLIAEYNGLPIAYLWSTPDYNQIFQKMNGRLGLYQLFQFLYLKNHINKGKLHFIGINKDFRHKNVGSYLNYEILVEMKKRGYIGAETVIDEGNAVAHKTIDITGAKPYKKYRVFEKDLHNT